VDAVAAGHGGWGAGTVDGESVVGEGIVAGEYPAGGGEDIDVVVGVVVADDGLSTDEVAKPMALLRAPAQ
jgi:hypothetical protein